MRHFCHPYVFWNFVLEKRGRKRSGEGAITESEDSSGTSSGSLNIEDSVQHLKDHTATLTSVVEAAEAAGNDAMASSGRALAATYDFTVQPKLVEGKYGDAAFEWDKADRDYLRLEAAYQGEADSSVTEAWQAYSTSRSALIDLKEDWANFRE